MPRKPRVEAPYAIHHVVAKGNAGEHIVRDDRDRRTLIGRIARSVETHGWACLSYCILDNHFHLVVQTPQPNLGAGMKWLKAAYAQDFNHRHSRYGHVFGGRFYSVVVERDSHLVSAIVYVALNPVRAGLAARPEHWPWSSYPALIGRAPVPAFLHRERVFELAGLQPETAERALAEAVRDAMGSSPRRWDAVGGQTRGV